MELLDKATPAGGGVYLFPAVLFFKFGGLSTLLRKATAGRREQHQTGRAGGRSICTLSKKSGRDDRPQGAVGRQKDMPFAVG